MSREPWSTPHDFNSAVNGPVEDHVLAGTGKLRSSGASSGRVRPSRGWRARRCMVSVDGVEEAICRRGSSSAMYRAASMTVEPGCGVRRTNSFRRAGAHGAFASAHRSLEFVHVECFGRATAQAFAICLRSAASRWAVNWSAFLEARARPRAPLHWRLVASALHLAVDELLELGG